MTAPTFGILGILEVRRDDMPLKLGGRHRRHLLAHLLANAGSRVSLDSICEAVWDGAPPDGAVATVRTYVSQFRKLDVTGSGLLIQPEATGYRISVDRHELDATRFEDQVAAARTLDDPGGRVAALEAALSLWRGPALVEFADSSWAATAAQRLSSIRDLAMKERFEALVGMGRHAECLVSLEQAVAEAPFDERLTVLLALARYRCGAVSAALRELSELRRRLGEELGLSPGAEVIDFERRLLNRDPGLDLERAGTDDRSAGAAGRVRDQLPQGTVTFFFTDTEGSTRLVRELGDDRYAEVLATQRAHLTETVQRNGGFVFGSEGDALFGAFASTSAAVSAAVDAQRVLAAVSWPAPVRTRIGLHTGEALLVGDDYVGATVHLAARIAKAAHGGQIVASEACRCLVSDGAWHDLGYHRLKDIDRPQHLYELGVDGASFPPLATTENIPTNLPERLDGFVGRDDDVAALVEMLADVRFVSIVGTGGVGKTRFAIETARSLRARYPGGVYVVELSKVPPDGDVAAAVARTLVEVGARGTDLRSIAADAVGEDEALLVLDNCEHVRDQAAAVTLELLGALPGLRVLATSREPLRTRGEHVRHLEPLDTNVDDHGSSAAEQLFVLRAEAATGRPLDPADRTLVRDICVKIDGLPLAIELAASRASSLAIVDIARRLDDRFGLLRSDRSGDDDRHQTLRAVVDWSFEQLSPTDRAIFNRLSVFSGDFTLDAAEFVASGDEVPAAYVIDGLSRLVDKSLVRLRVGDGGTGYSLLETMRSYGRARLEEAGRLRPTEDRFLEWALSLTTRLEQDMRTERQDNALASVVPHRSNLRLAVDLCRHRGQELEALRIVTSAPVDTPRERLRLIELLLPVVGHGSSDVLGRAHLAAANLEFERGGFVAGADHARSATRIFTEMGDARSVAWSAFLETFGNWGAGDLDRARTAVRAAREQFEALGDRVGFANASWAAIALEPDLAASDRIGERAEAELRAIDSPFALAHCLEMRALVMLKLGTVERARNRLAEAVGIFSSTRNDGCAAHCLEAIAAVIVATDTAAETSGVAAELLGAAEGLRTASGHEHRPWEVEGKRAALTILHDNLAPDELRAAIQRGRSHTLRSATQLAHHALERAAGVQSNGRRSGVDPVDA